MKKYILTSILIISVVLGAYAIHDIQNFIFDYSDTELVNKSNADNELFVSSSSCNPIQLPLRETFSTSSTTANCWSFYDLNQNGSAFRNKWYFDTKLEQISYYGINYKENDWLITPPLAGTGKNIMLEFELSNGFDANNLEKNNFTIYLSTSGSQPSDFNTEITKINFDQTNSSKLIQIPFLVPSGTFYVAFYVGDLSHTGFDLDNITIREVECAEPLEVGVSGILHNQAIIHWNDDFNQSWDYCVQEKGTSVLPSGQTATTQKSNIITNDVQGKVLRVDTEYEFFVRSNCSSGKKSEWIGPLSFTTACSPISTFPFKESFDLPTDNLSCWRLYSDKPQNAYKAVHFNNNGYNNSGHAFLNNTDSNTIRWLFSPLFDLGTLGNIYELSFYFKSTRVDPYTLYVSTNGYDYVEVLGATKEIVGDVYKKETYFFDNLSGVVRFAWGVENTDHYQHLSIDEFYIQKVACTGVSTNDVEVTNLTTSSATIKWEDEKNQAWEYFVLPTGNPMLNTYQGIATTSKQVVLATDNVNKNPLQPNTSYDVYIRSKCQNGALGEWNGPIAFKTLCNVMPLPFWEGFNVNSTSKHCWLLSENFNDDDISWEIKPGDSYEGTSSVSRKLNKKKSAHLVSPSFALEKSKIYRLRFHIKARASTSYSVKLATKGVHKSDFSKILQIYNHTIDTDWLEETIVFTNIEGTVNFGWFIEGINYGNFVLDNIFIEEISCPEPTSIYAEDVRYNQFDIIWKDDIANKWEYMVQPKGSGIPQTNGIATTNKRNTITKDAKGNLITPFTEYEFFVRSSCGGNKFGNWIGPHYVKTACDLVSLPFWEGFNDGNDVVSCWTIAGTDLKPVSLDRLSYFWRLNNKHQYSGSANYNIYEIPYEGEGNVRYSGWSPKKIENKLISPTLKFETGKTYRLKYNYLLNNLNTTNYDSLLSMQVLASNNGVLTHNFTHELLDFKQDKKSIKPNLNILYYQTDTAFLDYQLEKVFITGLSGEVNIAWNIASPSSTTVMMLDNIFVEEVLNCPEPSKVAVEKIGMDTATIIWMDDFANNGWEYVVQEATDNSKITKGNYTNSKSNTVITDYKGSKLKENTTYKVFVRTKCADGSYSIWTDEVSFTTDCGIFEFPFFEGFNKNSTQLICWNTFDFKGDLQKLSYTWSETSLDVQEGDQSLLFSSNYQNIYLESLANDKQYNYTEKKSYLISPTIKLKPGTYVLKYFYRSTLHEDHRNEHQVNLSVSGKEKDKFKTVIVQPITQATNNFEEVIRFFDIQQDSEINLAWITNTINTNYSMLFIDNIQLDRIETCAEPYNLRATNTTSTSISLTWDQFDTAASWDIYVFERGTGFTTNPVATLNVTGTPNATITGLLSNKRYDIYVRANCLGGTSTSKWSSVFSYSTTNRTNGDCVTAITIPVNRGANYTCSLKVESSLIGTTATLQPRLPNCNTRFKADVWFEFTAVTAEHLLTLLDFESKSIDKKELEFVLYDRACSMINGDSMDCFSLHTGNSIKLLKNLIPGNKYYLRVGTESIENEIFFGLCISIPQYLIVDDTQTADELVRTVLLNTACDLISNVSSRTGTYYNQDNGIAHFRINSPYFSFKEGMMLATNGVQYAKGPSSQFEGNRSLNWLGDDELIQLYSKYVSFVNDTIFYNSSMVEFDFVPLSNSITIDFLLASNEYGGYGHGTSWSYGNDLIGFFLTDLTTNETTNIGVVPQTKSPIFTKTIPYSSTLDNASNYHQYFDKIFEDKELINYYNPYVSNGNYLLHGDTGNTLPKELNSVNYRGMTKPMRAKSTVTPGRKYHLKLVIGNGGNYSNRGNSAVFFEAGSLDIKGFDLGDDLLIKTNTALCYNETYTIESNLSDDKNMVLVQWYKNGEELVGETSPNLVVKGEGVYKIVANFIEFDCESVGEIIVEVYPRISSVLNQPTALSVCKNTIEPVPINLALAIDSMFENTDLTAYNYNITYFEDEACTVQIDKPEHYISQNRENRKIYVLFHDPNTDCEEVFELNLLFVEGEKPDTKEDINTCISYILPSLEQNQKYYSESGAKGIEYKAGDVLRAGIYNMYVVQDNGGGCFEEVLFKIEIGITPDIQNIDDVLMSCQLYHIPEPLANNTFFIEENGQRIKVVAGTPIIKNNTRVYVVVTSDNGACVDETSFVVRYEDCPIPKGISPNGDGVNDVLDLTLHGVSSIKIFNRLGNEVYSFEGNYTNQWNGSTSKGKLLPSGTYYYVIQSFDKTRTGWVEINR